MTSPVCVDLKTFRIVDKKHYFSPVCSYNEWDPLEEVIVGRAENATVPSFNAAIKAHASEKHLPFFEQNACRLFPPEHVAKAAEEIEEFCRVLEHEGVTVRRPRIVDHSEVIMYVTVTMFEKLKRTR